jgi:hypothetical protein
MDSNDSFLKLLIGTACVAIIAAVGLYFYTAWASRPSETDTIMAQHNALMRALEHPNGN